MNKFRKFMASYDVNQSHAGRIIGISKAQSHYLAHGTISISNPIERLIDVYLTYSDDQKKQIKELYR